MSRDPSRNACVTKRWMARKGLVSNASRDAGRRIDGRSVALVSHVAIDSGTFRGERKPRWYWKGSRSCRIFARSQLSLPPGRKSRRWEDLRGERSGNFSFSFFIRLIGPRKNPSFAQDAFQHRFRISFRRGRNVGLPIHPVRPCAVGSEARMKRPKGKLPSPRPRRNVLASISRVVSNSSLGFQGIAHLRCLSHPFHLVSRHTFLARHSGVGSRRFRTSEWDPDASARARVGRRG